MKSLARSHDPTLLIRALLVVIVAGGGLLACGVRPSGGSQHLYRVLGAGVGEEAGKLSGRTAQVVLVVAGGEGNPAAEKNAQTFRAALAEQGFKILATETIPLPELAMIGGPGKKIPGQHYSRLAAKYPGAGAIISLAGFPAFSEAEPAPATAPRPLFIAVVTTALDPASDGQELNRLLQTGLVRLAVTRRGDSLPGSGGSQSLRAQFDLHYQVLAPAK